MYLKDNPALMKEVEDKVKVVLGMGVKGDSAAEIETSED
jgi:hypothetical protein